MSTLSACLRALAARGFTKVMEPTIDEDTITMDIEDAIESACLHERSTEDYTLIGDSIWMLPITEWSEPYWVAVPSPPPAWIPTVWERLAASAYDRTLALVAAEVES